MAVRIEHERAVVIRVVDRSQTGLAVVLRAVGERGAMEVIDGLAVGSVEGDVGAAAGVRRAAGIEWRADPELDLVGRRAVAETALVIVEPRDAERLQLAS